MYALMYKYLLLNRKVSLPGIGIFSIEHTAAKWNAADHLLQPPAETVQFKVETALADKQFYHFLAQEMKVSEVDAIKQFHDFSYDLKTALGRTDGMVLPGIGSLKKQQGGSLAFEADSITAAYRQPVAAPGKAITTNKTVEPVVVNNDKSSTNVELIPADEALEEPSRDIWWIYALALAAAGIIAIVIYYTSRN